VVAKNCAPFEANPDHRGSPYVVLTKRGSTALARLTKAADAHHAEVARRFASTDAKAIHRGPRRLLDAITSPAGPSTEG
jgi:hypothetical protein